MIQTLIVSNYRSLGRDVRLDLGPLSVLIGPNGAGKSNALDALSFVRDAVLLGLPAAITNRGGIDAVRRRSHGHPFNVRIEMHLLLDRPRGRATYGFELTGNRLEEYRIKSEWAVTPSARYERDSARWNGPTDIAPRVDEQSLVLTSLAGDERFKQLAEFLARISVYSIFPDTLREPQKFDSSRPMRRHGENWVSVLRAMLKEPEKDELLKGLGRLTGDVEDVRVSSAVGYLIAEFKHQVGSQRSRKWFEAARQSDGTLRVAGLLTALLQRPELPVICVEEPELTVHPGCIPMLYEYLAQASDVSQVIVTTHSPVLLDVIDLSQTSVFVVERRRGETRIAKAEEAQLGPVRDRLMTLGDLLLSGGLQLTLDDALHP